MNESGRLSTIHSVSAAARVHAAATDADGGGGEDSEKEAGIAEECQIVPACKVAGTHRRLTNGSAAQFWTFIPTKHRKAAWMLACGVD